MTVSEHSLRMSAEDGKDEEVKECIGKDVHMNIEVIHDNEGLLEEKKTKSYFTKSL